MENKNFKSKKTLVDEVREKATSKYDNEGVYIPAWQNILGTLCGFSIPFLVIAFLIDQFAPMTLGVSLVAIFLWTILYFIFFAEKVHSKYYTKITFYLLGLMPYFFTLYYLSFLNYFRLGNFLNGGEFDAKKTFGSSKAYILFAKLGAHTITVTLVIFTLIFIIAFAKYFFRKNKELVQQKNISDSLRKTFKNFTYVLVILIAITGVIEIWDSVVSILDYIWHSFIDIFNFV